MRAVVDRVVHENKLLAIIIRSDYSKEGIHNKGILGGNTNYRMLRKIAKRRSYVACKNINFNTGRSTFTG